MSERDDRYARNDMPSNTAEFRAAPDTSASTAQFRAFAAGQDNRTDQRRPDGSWPEQPWDGESPGGSSSRTVALIIGVVLVLAILIAVFVIG
jgi:hypothetical protein